MARRGARHGVVGDPAQAVLLGLVADRARDIEPRRVRRDDGVAALEEKPRGHRGGLAGLGPGIDLHQQALAGGEPPGLPEPAARAAGQAQGHAALPLHLPIHDGAADRTRRGAGALGRVDEEILQPPVHHQRGGAAAADLVQDDDAALHAGTPSGIG